MAKGDFSCKRCGREFSMAAHLARHMSSHGVKTTKKKTSKKSGKRLGRPPGSKNKMTAARVGRPPKGSFDLRGMHLEQLTSLISEARDEAMRKLREAQAALR